MDLNRLLHSHQRALIDGRREAPGEARRWAALRAEYYAEQISRTRIALGAPGAFTWPRDWRDSGERIVAHG